MNRRKKKDLKRQQQRRNRSTQSEHTKKKNTHNIHITYSSNNNKTIWSQIQIHLRWTFITKTNFSSWTRYSLLVFPPIYLCIFFIFCERACACLCVRAYSRTHVRYCGCRRRWKSVDHCYYNRLHLLMESLRFSDESYNEHIYSCVFDFVDVY